MNEPAAGGPGPRALTVPNALTGLRLCCLPAFIWLLSEPHHEGLLAAGFLLGGLGLTDTLDGYIARHFHQETALGKVADPLVDRVLVLTAVIGCALVGALPWWTAGLVLLREVLMLGGGVVLAFWGVRQLDVSKAGKAGAVGMMVALPWFLLGHAHFRFHAEALDGAWVAVIFGLVMAWGAAAGYVPRARRARAGRGPGTAPGSRNGETVQKAGG